MSDADIHGVHKQAQPQIGVGLAIPGGSGLGRRSDICLPDIQHARECRPAGGGIEDLTELWSWIITPTASAMPMNVWSVAGVIIQPYCALADSNFVVLYHAPWEYEKKEASGSPACSNAINLVGVGLQLMLTLLTHCPLQYLERGGLLLLCGAVLGGPTCTA
eukprot:4340943-Amphidinium_carterae.1